MAILEPLESGRGRAAPLPAAQPRDARAHRRVRGATAADVRAAVERRAQGAAGLGARCRSTSAAAYLRRAVRVLLAAPGRVRRGDPRARRASPRSRRSRSRCSRPATRSRSTRSARSASSPTARVPVHLMKTQEAAHLVPAARRGRHRHALELPVHALAEPDRAGADGRQRGGAEALGGDALLGPARRGAVPRRGPSGGRLPVPARRRRDRARAGRGGRRQDLVHRAASRTGRKVAEACGRQPRSPARSSSAARTR